MVGRLNCGLSSNPRTFGRRPALVIIDVQKAIDHASWARHGGRNHLQAEAQNGQVAGRVAPQGTSVADV
jgi:hypothetical protein